MSLKTQLLKCTLFVIFYVIVCFALLKLRENLYLSHQGVSNIFIKNNTSSTQNKCCVPLIHSPKPISLDKLKTPQQIYHKNLDAEILMIEQDELQGESINLQEIAVTLRQVSNVCKRYSLKTPLIKEHFLYDENHESLYCWIRKIASTSFTKIFSDMKHHHAAGNYYREGRYLAPQSLLDLQSIIEDKKIFKLLIVRHPFERLVSSYRDRIEDNSKYSAQAWIYTRKIFHVTRPHLFHSNISTGSALEKIYNRDRTLKIIPTFKEFVSWLLQQSHKTDDVHWNQYYTHCAVCNISYNFILKLDDYSFGQINYIFAKLGLDKNKIHLPTLEQSVKGFTDFHKTCKYMKTLTYDMVLKLYQRYVVDFEMYNYELEKYVQCISG